MVFSQINQNLCYLCRTPLRSIKNNIKFFEGVLVYIYTPAPILNCHLVSPLHRLLEFLGFRRRVSLEIKVEANLLKVSPHRMEYPRTRKRARLAWDVAPEEREVISCFAIACGVQAMVLLEMSGEWGGVARVQVLIVVDAETSATWLSLWCLQAFRDDAATTGRGASPPLRDDDRDGHYVFDLGENLTPRCKIPSFIHFDIFELNENENFFVSMFCSPWMLSISQTWEISFT